MTESAAVYARRLRVCLPARWFPDDSPVLAALLLALGQGWADLADLLTSVRRQSRLLTAEGSFLDLAARDFRGAGSLRRSGESDAMFRRRLLPIFRDKVTRAAVIARLRELGCTNVTIFEPARPSDTGGYGLAGGYGVAGGYGSLVMPAQSLVTAARPAGQGIPGVAGYGGSIGGYGAGAVAYSRLGDEAEHITDADIYGAVADTIPVGTVAWLALGGSAAGGIGYWDENFVWDQSTWA